MTWMSWEISQGSSVLVFHKSVKTELVSFENLFRNEEQKFQQLGVFWKCPLFTSLQIQIINGHPCYWVLFFYRSVHKKKIFSPFTKKFVILFVLELNVWLFLRYRLQLILVTVNHRINAFIFFCDLKNMQHLLLKSRCGHSCVVFQKSLMLRICMCCLCIYVYIDGIALKFDQLK